jgi:hypothetical protein
LVALDGNVYNTTSTAYDTECENYSYQMFRQYDGNYINKYLWKFGYPSNSSWQFDTDNKGYKIWRLSK